MEIYKKAERPFIVGTERVKQWQYDGQPEQTWAERAQKYWKLQERVYGVRFSRVALVIDRKHDIVSSAATVDHVLAGVRAEINDPDFVLSRAEGI